MPDQAINPEPIRLYNQYNVVFSGSILEYYRRWLPLAFLTVATGGIAWFWLSAAKRKYIFSHLSFLTSHFNYHGTGLGEAIRVLPWIAMTCLSLAGLQLFHWHIKGSLAAGVICACAIVLISIPSAWHSRYKYQMRHTTWGEQPLAYSTSTLDFTVHWVSGLLLSIVTLGFYLPRWRNQMFALRYNGIGCGKWQLFYTGQSGDLFEEYVSAAPAAFVTGGIFAAWLMSKISRYRLANIWVGGREIGSSRGYFGFSGSDYLVWWGVYLLVTPLTLGLMTPVLTIMGMYLKLHKFAIIGNLDLDCAPSVAETGVAA